MFCTQPLHMLAVASTSCLSLYRSKVVYVVSQWHMYPKMGAKFMTDETAQLAGALNMRHRCFLPPAASLPGFACA